MISLFGRKEYDPPTKQMQDPATALKVSLIWFGLSIAWLGLAADRISSLRASGRAVSGFRYATVWFWTVIMLFWCWNGWASYKKYRAEKEE